MARLIYSGEAFEDLERIIDHLLLVAPQGAGDALRPIRLAIAILATHPRIGRRVDMHRRELVISHGATGYLALYRHDAQSGANRILRIRHQREAGYRD